MRLQIEEGEILSSRRGSVDAIYIFFLCLTCCTPLSLSLSGVDYNSLLNFCQLITKNETTECRGYFNILPPCFTLKNQNVGELMPTLNLR